MITGEGLSFGFGILWSIATLLATGYYLYLHGVQLHMICTHKYMTATGYEYISYTTSHNNTINNTAFNVSDEVDVWVDLEKSNLSDLQRNALHNGSIILINVNESNNKPILGINGEHIKALKLTKASAHFGEPDFKPEGRAIISYWIPQCLMALGYTYEILFMLIVWVGNVAFKYFVKADDIEEDMSMAKKICFYALKTGCIAFIGLIIPLCVTCWIFPLSAFVFDNYVTLLPGFVFSYQLVIKIYNWSIILTIAAVLCAMCGARGGNNNENGGGGGVVCAVCCLCPIFFGSMVFGVVVKIYAEYQSLLAYGLLAVSFFGDLLTCSHFGRL